MRSFFAVYLLSACGGSSTVATKGITDSITATKAVAAINHEIQAAVQTATATGAADSASAQFKLHCDSGTASASITAAGNGSSAQGTYSLVFDSCTLGGESLDGSLTWSFAYSSTASGNQGSLQINGTVSYEGPTYAGVFSFNSLDITFSTSSSSVQVMATGSYTVGGTTYAVDNTSAQSIFGG